MIKTESLNKEVMILETKEPLLMTPKKKLLELRISTHNKMLKLQLWEEMLIEFQQIVMTRENK